MTPNREHLERLISSLDALRLSAYWIESEHAADLAMIAEGQRESARNLLHYLALRRRDLRDLQRDLAAAGLSSLGRAESHVLGTVGQVRSVLCRLLGKDDGPPGDGIRAIDHGHGRAALAAHTEALLGPAVRTSEEGPENARIMVTMPLAAATDCQLVTDLLRHGMSCMRINCAHDTSADWGAMVENLEKARRETGRPCRLFMDLGGPKLRTGAFEPGPRVISWEPKRDFLGNVVRPATIWLTPPDRPEPEPIETSAIVPIHAAVLDRLFVGARLLFHDLRGRRRALHVLGRAGSKSSWIAHSDQITYLGAECEITPKPPKGSRAHAGELPPPFCPLAIPPQLLGVSLTAGDHLVLTAEPVIGRSIERDESGALVEEPVVACTLPAALEPAQPGESILFDDGKITGVVVGKAAGILRVRITQPAIGAKKLRADKGINLPDTRLELPAITAKDLQDLDFVAGHADIVGLSFVNRTEDVEFLQREIHKRTRRPVGIVLKIETRRSFENLPRLLLAGMRTEPFGIMIARGDLAVECGFERLAELQEEILWICEAAHVPVIWATQVLESLSKKGTPTRAEISDAALAEQAECVMLNKGPHIVETVSMLGGILTRMQAHHDKKSPLLRALQVSRMKDSGA
jgi:pyruvate kinase